jgi:hypothetical protein
MLAMPSTQRIEATRHSLDFIHLQAKINLMRNKKYQPPKTKNPGFSF